LVVEEEEEGGMVGTMEEEEEEEEEEGLAKAAARRAYSKYIYYQKGGEKEEGSNKENALASLLSHTQTCTHTHTEGKRGETIRNQESQTHNKDRGLTSRLLPQRTAIACGVFTTNRIS
jgi:hypothetical protein